MWKIDENSGILEKITLLRNCEEFMKQQKLWWNVSK